eukprot:357713-Chlamydomonas_euryale.AAC.18
MRHDLRRSLSERRTASFPYPPLGSKRATVAAGGAKARGGCVGWAPARELCHVKREATCCSAGRRAHRHVVPKTYDARYM